MREKEEADISFMKEIVVLLEMNAPLLYWGATLPHALKHVRADRGVVSVGENLAAAEHLDDGVGEGETGRVCKHIGNELSKSI